MPHRWSKHASIRKQQIESGLDITFKKVFLPIYIKLFQQINPNSAIDVGAGTGHLALNLQPYCNNITAIEPSIGMYNTAKETLRHTNIELLNTSTYNHNISELFDFAYTHMCAHTIDSIPDFFSSIRSLLNKNGTFVFSIPHPCFYYLYKNYFGSQYSYMQEMHKEVDLTISNDQDNIMKNIPYYHRPLSQYINHLANAGFTVSNMIEAWPNSTIQSEYDEKWNAPRYCILTCKITA